MHSVAGSGEYYKAKQATVTGSAWAYGKSERGLTLCL